MSPKTRNIIGWILSGLLAAFMLFSAIGKLSGKMDEHAAAMGVTPEILRILGSLEIISVILMLIPRTGVVGSLLLMAYMGGAIATHLQHGMPVTIPVAIECYIWIMAVIRFPELGSRLFGNPARV